jgi:hypothetical protein
VGSELLIGGSPVWFALSSLWGLVQGSHQHRRRDVHGTPVQLHLHEPCAAEKEAICCRTDSTEVPEVKTEGQAESQRMAQTVQVRTQHQQSTQLIRCSGHCSSHRSVTSETKVGVVIKEHRQQSIR